MARQNTMKTTVDMWSDPTCPWCYIGYQRLKKALTGLAGRHRPRIVWRAFLLNPAMPADGMERNAWLARAFGNSRLAETTLDRITQHGLAEGIPFAFSAISRTPSALRAQALILGVHDSGRQMEVIDGIFRSHFVAGRDIGDPGVLADIAENAGFNRVEALAWIDSIPLTRRLLHDARKARDGGIRSVPFFVFNRSLAIGGAQSAEVLRRLVTTAGDCGEL